MNLAHMKHVPKCPRAGYSGPLSKESMTEVHNPFRSRTRGTSLRSAFWGSQTDARRRSRYCAFDTIVFWPACMKIIQSQLGSSECSGYQTAVVKAGLEAADGDCTHVKEVGKQYFSTAPSSCCPGIRALVAQAC